MLLAFAFSFIGILLVYGNYKLLRNLKALTLTFIVSSLLALLGIYLVLTTNTENTFLLMALVSPLIASILLAITQFWYLRVRGQHIILYLGGFLPKKHEERFVSRLEKLITFLITLLALLLPYLVVLSLK